MSQVLNEQPTHVGKNIKASQHVDSTENHLSYSSSTDLSKDIQVQFLRQKPTQLVTSQPKPFCPLPHPWDQQELRLHSHQQTPKPTEYLRVSNATFYISLIWYFSSVSGDLPQATRWRHHPSWTPHVFIARRNKNPPYSSPSSWPV